jgi:hypothetical protein
MELSFHRDRAESAGKPREEDEITDCFKGVVYHVQGRASVSPCNGETLAPIRRRRLLDINRTLFYYLVAEPCVSSGCGSSILFRPPTSVVRQPVGNRNEYSKRYCQK